MNENKLKPHIILGKIWSNLEEATKDRNHEYHNVIFSNLENLNQVNSRIVILRNFSKLDNCLSFHTDYRSAKIKQIKENDKCSLLFYSHKIKQQLRINVKSTIHNNDNISKNAWNKTKLMSRKCYLTSFPPGSMIDKPDDGIPYNLKGIEPNHSESEKGYTNFTVILNYIKSIDWLYLSSQGHRRLLYKRVQNKWVNKWTIP